MATKSGISLRPGEGGAANARLPADYGWLRILARYEPSGDSVRWRRAWSALPAGPGGSGMDTGIAPDKVQDEGGSFTGAVQLMFDRLAPRYDSFNRWASLGLDHGWRRAAIGTLGELAAGRVLDVATGTGDVALACADAGGSVVGCDFAPEMIALARQKATARAHGSAVFHVARAEQLPYPDDSFDAATSAFAMRNVRPFLDQVLTETLRVLRPGGRFVILEFSEPRLAPVRWGHHLYTRHLVPWIGARLTGSSEPFDYLQRSIDAWDGPVAFAERIGRCGYRSVGFRRLSLGTVALHWGDKP